MELAKPALDVGLYTNQLDPMLAFWQDQAKVPFSEMLPVGKGVRQHRHAIGDSVLKINHQREPLAGGQPTGLRALTVYSAEVAEPVELLDPDGNELILAPVEEQLNLTLHLHTADLDAQRHFYGSVLNLAEHGTDGFAVGASRIQLQHDPQANPGAPFTRAAVGFRYMTLQVFDVVGTHQEVLRKGGREGMAPVRLGDVAYISFVLDADGNWLEISQRKSITGSLD